MFVQASEVEEGIEPREPAGDVLPAVADEVRFAFSCLLFRLDACCFAGIRVGGRGSTPRGSRLPSGGLSWPCTRGGVFNPCLRLLAGRCGFCMQESGLETEEAADGIESQACVLFVNWAGSICVCRHPCRLPRSQTQKLVRSPQVGSLMRARAKARGPRAHRSRTVLLVALFCCFVVAACALFHQATCLGSLWRLRERLRLKDALRLV